MKTMKILYRRMSGKENLIRFYADLLLKCGRNVTIVRPDCIIQLTPEVLDD